MNVAETSGQYRFMKVRRVCVLQAVDTLTSRCRRLYYLRLVVSCCLTASGGCRGGGGFTRAKKRGNELTLIANLGAVLSASLASNLFTD